MTKYKIFFNSRQRILSTDIAIFLRQFSTLLMAGVPLIKCFEVLEKSQIKQALRLLIYALKREVLSGKNLYHSFQQQPQFFDNMTCQLLKIGEQTGNLDKVLVMIADEKEKNLLFVRKIKQALFYPMILGLIALSVTIIMFLFVVPRFAELFAESHIKLPFLTECLFMLGSKMQYVIYLILCCMILLLFLLFPLPEILKIRLKIKSGIMTLPFVRKTCHKIRLTMFIRNLIMTLSAGMPLSESLKLLTFAQTDTKLVNAIIGLRSKIHSGLQLHEAMASEPVFPDLMIQMVRMGEESGKLEELLNKLGDMFTADTQQHLQQISQLLEPLIMLVLGVLIGGLVIGMDLPLFQLGNAL